MKTLFTQTVNQAVFKFASAGMLAATFVIANIASINVANAADVSANTTMSATQSADWQQKRTQKMAERAAHMLKNAQAAANANINVSQAISIAQSQVTNGTAMHVFYGNKMKHKGKHAAMQANQNGNANGNQKADYENAYHVGVKAADGQAYHIVVDANTGAVLKKEQKQRRNQRGNNQSQQKTEPAVSLTTAMTTAANQVGGKAVSAGFSRMGKMGKARLHGAHGQRGQRFANSGNRQARQQQQHQRPNQRPDKNVTPSYHVQVLKNNQLYFVKVDAQTGKVIDSKTQAQMQQILQEKLAKRQQKRHGNS